MVFPACCSRSLTLILTIIPFNPSHDRRSARFRCWGAACKLSFVEALHTSNFNVEFRRELGRENHAAVSFIIPSLEGLHRRSRSPFLLRPANVVVDEGVSGVSWRCFETGLGGRAGTPNRVGFVVSSASVIRTPYHHHPPPPHFHHPSPSIHSLGACGALTVCFCSRLLLHHDGALVPPPTANLIS